MEDLAQAGDEPMKRIGMGALEVRDKAIAWLKSASGSGHITQEMSALQAKVRALESALKASADNVAALQAENQELLAKVSVKAKAA